MKFDLKRPCAQCPFRTDIEPYLRQSRVRELEHALVQKQQTFSCHKTVDYSEGDQEDEQEDEQEHRPAPDEQHCAGALILLEKLMKPNQMMRWMERVGAYDRTKLDMRAPVFDSFTVMRRAQRNP